MRLRLPAAAFPLLLLLALTLAGCGDASPRRPDVTLTPIAPVDGVLTVRASEWGFEPSAITLRQGEEVRIVFVNDGKIPHNLKLDDLAVDVTGAGDEGELFVETVDGGEERTLTFVPQASGSFTFYCAISGHRRLGMEGTLTVAP